MTTPANSWRRNLILSLQDSGETQRAQERRLLWGVIAFLVFSVIATQVAGLLSGFMRETDALPLLFLLLIAAIALVTPAWFYGNRFMMRMRSGSASERLLSDARRPILYLRSFDFERSLGPGLSGLGPEEVLVARFARVGPVIAIGRPGEPLPPVGAARFYTSEANWKQKIGEVCAAAQYVVWVTGTSPGLAWELSHILESVPKDRVIVVAHPQWLSRSAAQREAEWGRFQSALGALFPMRLPVPLGSAWLFHFNAAGQILPIEAGARTGLSLDRRSHGLNTAIDALFVAKGLLAPAKLARRRWMAWSLAALLVLALVLFGLGILTQAVELIFPGCILLLVAIFASLPLMGRNPKTLPAPERA